MRYLIVLFLFFSCKPQKEKKHLINHTFKASITDTLAIKMPANVDIEFSHKTVYNDTLYSINKNKVVITDLNNQKFIDTISIQDYLIKSKLRSITVINKDSIILSDSTESFILINDEGELLSNYKIGNNNIALDSQFFNLIPYVRSQYSNNTLFFPILPYTYFEAPFDHQHTNRIAVLPLNEEVATTSIIPTAESAFIPKGYNYPTDMVEPNLLVSNNKVIVSYPYDNTIEVFNLQGERLFRKKIESSFTTNEITPLTINEYKSHQKLWNRRITMPFFDNINYHSKMGIYSRILYHKQDLKMSNGKLNDGSKRTASIILMDKNFNTVGETLFENGSLGVYKSLPLSDGFLIATNPKYWTDEDKLIYKYKYKIEKIKN